MIVYQEAYILVDPTFIKIHRKKSLDIMHVQKMENSQKKTQPKKKKDKRFNAMEKVKLFHWN